MQDANVLITNSIIQMEQESSNKSFQGDTESVKFRKKLEEIQANDASNYYKKYGNQSVILTKPSQECKYKQCDGSGWIEIAHPPFGYLEHYQYSGTVVRRCICKGGKEASEFRKVRSMIPFEYLEKHGKDFKWDFYQADINEQRMIVNSFILKFEEFQKQGKGLYIHSTAKGSGKTFLACCIANELSEKGVSSKFINLLDLIELSRKSFDKNENKSDGYKGDLDAIFQTNVLIIDDLGCEQRKEQDWVSDLLLRLINTRHGKKQITIYTSNLSIEELRLDDRITSRIQEASIAIKIPNESIRSKLAKENNNEFLKSVIGG